MSTSDLRTLTSTPKSLHGKSLTTEDPTDVYKFKITDASNINLSLNEISFGDDADLLLYQDSNRNGRLDSSDPRVGISSNSSNSDDAINIQASAGTYFAKVERYGLGSSGSVTYDLDMSATPPAPTTEPSNLLPREVRVGDPSSFLFQDTLFEDKTFHGSLDNNNTVDVYSFHLLRNGPDTIGSDTVSSITLSGLSSDADIRLIRDFNENQIVDLGDEITRSQNSGITDEAIFNIDQAGSYYLQVYQYSGSTNYTLSMDYTYVPPA
jgi:hypothetical protein